MQEHKCVCGQPADAQIVAENMVWYLVPGYGSIYDCHRFRINDEFAAEARARANAGEHACDSCIGNMIRSRSIRVRYFSGEGICYPKYCDVCLTLHEDSGCDTYYLEPYGFLRNRDDMPLLWNVSKPRPDWLVDSCSVCDVCREHLVEQAFIVNALNA
jgi:hypothetical protein